MKAQKGFVEGALPQLLLVLISFAVIAMIITNIFSGSGGIQEKLCLAVPFFCGTQTGIDYEVSARSTNAMACAIGSAFTGTKWPGGSGFTCEEFYDKTASTGGGGGGGGSGTADIVATGAASADEESLTINKIRNLKPLVLCDPEKKKPALSRIS